ncbi:MAG TPA: twin-arginine translocase subunit TatC [Rhizomicrobium sp.]|nr:twin-arginine translocase subunit TatC [Rhizomicrobium sp.]
MSAISPEDEAAIEATKAPLMEHLVELRKRIVWSLVSFGAAFLVCFFFAKDIYLFLEGPLAHALKGEANQRLIYTALPDVFFTYVKVGMFAGLGVSFPLIAAQLWMFVAPGLYKHEKSAFLPFLVATPVMFLMGAAFVYYVLLPFAIKFFLSFETMGTATTLPIQLQARVNEYLDFVMTLIIVFGLCFQLPVLLSLLGRVGIITSQQLRSVWRYAVVGIVGVAAIITPPDPLSMMSLVVPLVALYGVSILCVMLIERGRAKREAEREKSSSA